MRIIYSARARIIMILSRRRGPRLKHGCRSSSPIAGLRDINYYYLLLIIARLRDKRTALVAV